jgi:antitoxin VapB
VAKVLNVKNEQAYRLAAQLAELKGESLTEAVLKSLQERLDREWLKPKDDIVQRLLAIGERLASAPTYDERTPDEIIGYDEYGVPR